jgi:hypothetical protein
LRFCDGRDGRAALPLDLLPASDREALAFSLLLALFNFLFLGCFRWEAEESIGIWSSFFLLGLMLRRTLL